MIDRKLLLETRDLIALDLFTQDISVFLSKAQLVFKKLNESKTPNETWQELRKDLGASLLTLSENAEITAEEIISAIEAKEQVEFETPTTGGDVLQFADNLPNAEQVQTMPDGGNDFLPKLDVEGLVDLKIQEYNNAINEAKTSMRREHNEQGK